MTPAGKMYAIANWLDTHNLDGFSSIPPIYIEVDAATWQRHRERDPEARASFNAGTGAWYLHAGPFGAVQLFCKVAAPAPPPMPVAAREKAEVGA